MLDYTRLADFRNGNEQAGEKKRARKKLDPQISQIDADPAVRPPFETVALI
jgi:hypothetical protein